MSLTAWKQQVIRPVLKHVWIEMAARHLHFWKTLWPLHKTVFSIGTVHTQEETVILAQTGTTVTLWYQVYYQYYTSVNYLILYISKYHKLLSWYLSYVETCSDGIENQDEVGVDCGGRCVKCGKCILWWIKIKRLILNRLPSYFWRRCP